MVGFISSPFIIPSMLILIVLGNVIGRAAVSAFKRIMAKKKKVNVKQKETEVLKATSKVSIVRENLNDRSNLNVMEDETIAEALEDNMQTVEDNAMPIDENNEVSLEDDGLVHKNANPSGKRKTKGPTKMKRLPSDATSRVEVEFNATVEAIRPGSVALSS